MYVTAGAAGPQVRLKASTALQVHNLTCLCTQRCAREVLTLLSMHGRSYDTLEVVRLDDRAFTYLYTEGQQSQLATMIALPDLL